MRTEKSRAREKDLCAVKGTLSRRFCCNFDQNSTENIGIFICTQNAPRIPK